MTEATIARAPRSRKHDRIDKRAHGFEPLADVERAYTIKVLTAFEGNMSATARVLRVDRRTLYRWIAKWKRAGVALPEIREGAE